MEHILEHINNVTRMDMTKSGETPSEVNISIPYRIPYRLEPNQPENRTPFISFRVYRQLFRLSESLREKTAR